MTYTSPLYRPQFEHDACGIGAVVDIKGRRSYGTVDNALEIVEKLEHRAGKDAAGETGDGVGILLQIPHRLLSRWAEEQGLSLGEERDYGVGMFFFPQEELRRRSWFDAFRQVLARRLERGGDRARRLAAIQKDADGCIYRRFTQEEDFCPCGCRQLTEQLRLWVNDASKTMAGDVSKVYRSLTGQFSQFTKQNIQEPFGLSSSSAYAPQPVSIERRLSTPI